MKPREIIDATTLNDDDQAAPVVTTTIRTDHPLLPNADHHHHHNNNNVVVIHYFPPCHEWKYFCEGGRHVVFAYTRTTTTTTDTAWLWNKLLRLDKAIFRNVGLYQHHHHQQHTSSSSSSSPLQQQQQQQQYTVTVSLDDDPYRNHMYQMLHPYVNVPNMIRPNGASGLTTDDDTPNPTFPTTDQQQQPAMWDTYWSSLRHEAEPYIPPRRRTDWYPSTDCSTTNTSSNNNNTMMTTTVTSTFGDTTARVLVLPDYRFHLPMTTGTTTTTSICIEMKPKCGVTPVSPFIQSRRRNKYATSRFVLQQTLYQTRQLTKDWMPVEKGPHESNGSSHCQERTVAADTSTTSTFERSDYDPLDLFSQHPTRIRRAMRHLVMCPQNNFKLWHQDQLIWGHGCSTGPTTRNDHAKQHRPHAAPLDWRCLGASIGLSSLSALDDPTTAVLEFVMAATTTILANEDFLPRISMYQKLDLLDTDGAMAVYQRLLELCDDQSTVADAILDAPMKWADPTAVAVEEDMEQLPSILCDCPIQLPKMHSNIVQLCALVDAMASILSQSETNTTHRNERIDEISRRAHIVVDAMSIDECCYLLQAWLFSLSMCDLTFFINLHMVPTNHDPECCGGGEHDNTNCHDDSSGFRIRSLQSNRYINYKNNSTGIPSNSDETTPGCLEYRNHITNEYQRLHYQIKVIDIDRKPAKKIQSRYAKERQFDNV